MHAEQQSFPKVNLYLSKTLFEKKNVRNQKRFAQMLKRKTALSTKNNGIKPKKIQITTQNNPNRIKTDSPVKNRNPLKIKIITQTENLTSKKEESKNYNNEIIINISSTSSGAKNENSSKISNILNENNNNNSSTNNSNNNSCILKDSKEKEINISTLENASEEEIIPNLNNENKNNENNNINDEEEDDNNLRNKINNLYDYDNDDSISKNLNSNNHNNHNSKIKEENQFALKYLSSSSDSFVQLDNNLVTRAKFQNNHFTDSYFQALFPQLSLDDNHKTIKDKNYNVSEIIKEEKEIETPLRNKKSVENVSKKNKQKKYHDYFIKRNCKKNLDTENKTIHESINENLNSFISFNSIQNLSMSAVILNNKKNNANIETKLVNSYKKKNNNAKFKYKNNKISLLKKNLKLKKCLTKNVLHKNKKTLHYMYSANLSIKKHIKKDKEMAEIKNSLLINYKKNLGINNKSKLRLKIRNSSCITDTSSIKNNANTNGHYSVLNFREGYYNHSIDRADKIINHKKQISFFDKSKKYGNIIDTHKINKNETLTNLTRSYSKKKLNFDKERPSSTKNNTKKKSLFNLYFSSSKVLIKKLPKKKIETNQKRNKICFKTIATKSKESIIINSSLMNLNNNSIISKKSNLNSNKKLLQKKSKFTLINKKFDYSHIKPKVETNLNQFLKKNKKTFNKSISCLTTKDKNEEDSKKICFKKKKLSLYNTVMNFNTAYHNVNFLKNDKIKTESKLLLNKNDTINKSCMNFRKKIYSKDIKSKNAGNNK